MVVKCQNKSMGNKLYVTKYIASVYQIVYSLLSLNPVWMLSVFFLPSSLFPSLPPYSLLFYLLFLCSFPCFFHSLIVLPSFSFLYTLPLMFLVSESILILVFLIPNLSYTALNLPSSKHDLREQMTNIGEDHGKDG